MKKFIKETSKKFATGTLAILATIGGANIGVFAGDNTPDGTTSIPRTRNNVSVTGNIWKSGDELNLSSSGDQDGTIPVKGYQTSKVYSYELNVSWGDMKFIFDRGVYDLENNQLTKKVTGGCWDYCEAGAISNGAAATTGEGVGTWCGFDGTNNHVNVENLGNGDVQMAVACTEGIPGGQTLGNSVDLQIAVTNEDVASTVDNWSFTGSTTNDKMRACDGEEAVDMTITSGAGTAAMKVIQKAFDSYGYVSAGDTSAANQADFYLNITGEPTQGANETYLNTLDEMPSTDGGWEQLGTINLTFTPQVDS